MQNKVSIIFYQIIQPIKLTAFNFSPPEISKFNLSCLGSGKKYSYEEAEQRQLLENYELHNVELKEGTMTVSNIKL